jgi:hypothetical protein
MYVCESTQGTRSDNPCCLYCTALHCPALQAPTRRLRSVEVFASTWNMGGVDRESCATSGVGGVGDEEQGAKSALQLVIPLWIPRGYDLYVRATVVVVALYNFVCVCVCVCARARHFAPLSVSTTTPTHSLMARPK